MADTKEQEQEKETAGVELEPLSTKPQDGQGTQDSSSQFEVYTSDVTFTTKTYLLTWKNFKIQMLRRPKACCCKVCIPIFIMAIMALFTAIPGIRESVDKQYGAELEYVLSTSGDAAQYTNWGLYGKSYLPAEYRVTGDRLYSGLPWPDTSVANEWMKYIVCHRSSRGGEWNPNDVDSPSYLAIVAEDYDSNANLQALMSILEGRYGDSGVYPDAFVGNAVASGTWNFAETFLNGGNTPSPTSEPTMEPTVSNDTRRLLFEDDSKPRATMANTGYYTTAAAAAAASRRHHRLQPAGAGAAAEEEDRDHSRSRRRSLLQAGGGEDTDPLCDVSPTSELSDLDTLRLMYFPPKCEPYSCLSWSRHTDFLNFTAGSLLKFFSSESELEDYVQDIKYGAAGFNFENTAEDALRPIGAAIVFEKTGGDTGLEWDYTLRFNSSEAPSTETPIDKFSRDIYGLFSQSVGYQVQRSGAVHLQNWLDEGIMQFVVSEQYASDSATQSTKLQELRSKTADYSKSVFQFGVWSYERDDFWPSVADLFLYFVFIMFCYPVVTVISVLVEEKNSKIKEGMKMMGATSSAYWTSWLIYFFCEFTAMALFVAAMGSIFNIFKYSSFGMVFLWFWLFCLSSASFAMFASTLFDKSVTAVLCGIIGFFTLLIGGTFSGGLSPAGKRGLCLLSPSCFMIGVDTIVQYESGAIGVTSATYRDDYNDFTFETGLIMMFVDTILYVLLTLYMDQVFPSQFGQKLPFWFVCSPSFWKRKCRNADAAADEKKEVSPLDSAIIDRSKYEAANNNKGDPMIAVRNLSKTFAKFGLTESTRKQVKAVQGVSLDMYRGEVFCLLGHNGAGKTTTISMLSGLLEITGGDAFILNEDVSNPSAMSEVRKHLGVCPQHDVLWDRLTVKEHLRLFARLKGVPSSVVEGEVDKIARDTGLSEDGNDDKFPPGMSGGQRRKLSLGIALIGGSRVVFLDEPTSGMDPSSRRVTWNLISQEKKNRCIVLTTHFMDEADILGDRIAIMGGGKVKCCGSSLFLKQQYGVGYTFTVSLETSDEVAKDIDHIKQQVDAVTFEIIQGAQSVALAGSELTYRLPFEQSGKFSTLFDTLDQQKEKLSIKSYGISVTTLEEVFLKIGHDEVDDEADFGKTKTANADDEENEGHKIGMEAADRDAAADQFKQQEMSTFALQEQSALYIFFIHVYAVLYKRFWWSLRDFQALICALLCPVVLSAISLGLLTIQIASNQPTLELVVVPGPMFAADNTAEIPSDANVIDDNFYATNNTLYTTYATYLAGEYGDIELVPIDVNASRFFSVSDCVEQAVSGEECEGYDVPADYPFYAGITHEFQDWLLDKSAADNHPIYNAFLFFPYSETSNTQKRVYLGVNGSALYGVPTTLNLWNNWILNDIVAGDVSPSKAYIKSNIHPLPVTERQNLISGQITGFMQSLFLVIAFAFIPSGAIYFIVNEKTNLTKHQQLVSGISLTAYWTSNYIMDICIGLPASILVFLCVFVFDAEAFQGDAAGPFFLTLVLFLISALPFTYLLSFLFKRPSIAQLATILLFIIFGLFLGLTSFILDLFPSTMETNADLKPLYRIFPVFTMCESLLTISLKPLLYQNADFSDWDVLGRNYVILVVEGIGYFCLVLLVEFLATFPALLAKLGFVTNSPLVEREEDLDVDVLAERKRILGGLKQDENGNVSVNQEALSDAVVIAGLRKVYKPEKTGTFASCKKTLDEDKNVAVRNLHFGVKQSEVFGFLGVNGAGKTTTLAALTGERYPSSGDAFIANFPISSQLQCRRYVGYCPQFDAIFDLLTASEHLKFYAMIKGLRGDEADSQVKVLLDALTLNKYKNRTAGTYSGGNKRKLSVAVAMIGNPPVIFLDEPSTGMDPVSRRFMWEFISTTMAGRCVILTTHSMEECEALCNRVGIMVNGQLQCIGSAQHLKSRYGKGFQLDITLTQGIAQMDDAKEQAEKIEELQNGLAAEFGQITLIEHNGSKISYELMKNDQLPLGAMFNALEKMKNSTFSHILQAYALSQTTLEQIFLRMAKHGHEDKDKEKTVIMDPNL